MTQTCTSAAASFDAETRSLPLCDVTWAATPGHPFVAFVESETTKGTYYRVEDYTGGQPSCTCKGSRSARPWCKHIALCRYLNGYPAWPKSNAPAPVPASALKPLFG